VFVRASVFVQVSAFVRDSVFETGNRKDTSLQQSKYFFNYKTLMFYSKSPWKPANFTCQMEGLIVVLKTIADWTLGDQYFKTGNIAPEE
jgi:hypothetical protein